MASIRFRYEPTTKLGKILSFLVPILIFGIIVIPRLILYSRNSFEINNNSYENLYIYEECSLWSFSCKFRVSEIKLNNEASSWPELSITLNNVNVRNNLFLRTRLYGNGMKVGNETYVSGTIISVNNSSFNNLLFGGKEITLHNSKAKNIVFNDCNRGRRGTKCNLTLKDTIVEGSVIFNQGIGIIYMNENSQIVGGVENGEIQILHEKK